MINKKKYFKRGDIVVVLPSFADASEDYRDQYLVGQCFTVDEIVTAPITENENHCAIWVKEIPTVFSEFHLARIE